MAPVSITARPTGHRLILTKFLAVTTIIASIPPNPAHRTPKRARLFTARRKSFVTRHEVTHFDLAV
jgi:hypothetical protein